MAHIAHIYTTYQIPPPLQKHMYQVAALGLLLADHIQTGIAIDKTLITTVNLLHDIGNIIKFDFRPGKLIGIPDDEIAHWKEVQETFIAAYGKDEHTATEQIAAELGVNEEVTFFLHQTGIAKIEYALLHDDWNAKIIRICDERVSPRGVVTIEERYRDLLERYKGRNHKLADVKAVLKRKEAVLALQAHIQKCIRINLEGITDAMIEPYISKLQTFEV